MIRFLHILRNGRYWLRGKFYGIFVFGCNVKYIGDKVIFTGKIKLSDGVRIRNFATLIGNITVGKGCVISENAELLCISIGSVLVGDKSTVNRNTCVRGNVIIGKNCSIGPNCVIVGADHIFSDKSKLIKAQGIASKGIVIEEDVWIGGNVTILDGVRIGQGAVIGGGAVVTGSIPPYCVAVGNPCKVIKNRG